MATAALPGYLTQKETGVRLPRQTRVKNKTPAPIQITAEQILREARAERDKQDALIRRPQSQITDQDELDQYRKEKRQQFETLMCKQGRLGPTVWVRYARWEESQGDQRRARSVMERAIAANPRDHTVYLKYAEMEMKNKFVNRARNVWDRAVAILPRVDQLWYKYIHMEEVLGNYPGVRQIFDRWMEWRPDEEGWMSYVRFELRYKEIERARLIFEKFVENCPKASAWIRYAKFERNNGEIARARSCYERAAEKVEKLVGYDDGEAEKLFVAFAEFEEGCKEMERARLIYKFALDRIPKGQAEELYAKALACERQYGGEELIEDAVLAKKRFEYEEQVRKNRLNYDVWFDYIWLEESMGGKEKIREVYERAIANVPPADEKRYWLRYIYLWINYALYEELDAKDIDRTREVYRQCLRLIPHDKFSFAKIWLMAAKFEIRQLNLKDARLILGSAIGKASKPKIFEGYIDIELQFGNLDRIRMLYQKCLDWSPDNTSAWIKYAHMERDLDEIDRARAIFELAVNQPSLDKPEDLWKAYIDFESINESEKARDLYKRLLDRTKHLKVWISYAKFEAFTEENDRQASVDRAREVFGKALDYFRTDAKELREERVMLLDEWLKMEAGFGTLGDTKSVLAKKPQKIKKKRYLQTTKNGVDEYEEYIGYIFPEEKTVNLKILEAAHKWKKQKIGSGDD